MLVLEKDCGVTEEINFILVTNELKKYKVDILGVCLNYKIYSVSQLSNFVYFCYERNIFLFYNILRGLLKKPVVKFIK
jgi:hypothetical protein